MYRCLSCMREFDIENIAKGESKICPFCGYDNDAKPAELYHLSPGTILRDRYILGLVIGFGGFGVTYKAWDKSLDMVVAIKEYYPTGIVQRMPGDSDVSIYATDRKKEYYEGMTRFLSEAKNMACFSDIANIVHVNNYFEENNTAYIVMEHLEGKTLKKLLKEKGTFSDEEIIDIMIPVMDALQGIHRRGIIHRDVSPENIYICNSGDIKLIDFGAARFSDTENEMTRSVILKAGYAPVEQYMARSKQGPYTDIYALGATMYKCLTGVTPDESVSRANEDTLKSPEEVDGSIPRYISESIMKAMAINAELRFQNIAKFKNVLLKKRVVKSEKREIKARKSRRIIIVLDLVIAIAFGGLSAYKYYQEKSNGIVLEKAEISIWIPVQVEGENIDEELALAEQNIYDMSEKFLEEQKAIDIQVTAIPVDEYEDRLNEAALDNSLPTLFLSDGLSGKLIDEAVILDDIFDYIDVSACYYLDEYKKEISEGKQFPTAFNVPVVYVRRTNGVDMDTVEISALEQLNSGSSKGYMIDSDCYAMFINSLGGSISSDRSELDEKTVGLMNQIQEDMDDVETDVDDNASQEDVIYSAFENGDITYYVSTLEKYNFMTQEMPGLYSLRPITTDEIYGEFARMWSISGDADKEEILAAKVLINYYLAERPQKSIYISENILPLNKEAFESMDEIDSNYNILDAYVEKVRFDLEK